jgi:hypothetical protein
MNILAIDTESGGVEPENSLLTVYFKLVTTNKKLFTNEFPDVIALGYDQKVIVDNLAEKVGDKVKIVLLEAFKPEIYKTSLLLKRD